MEDVVTIALRTIPQISKVILELDNTVPNSCWERVEDVQIVPHAVTPSSHNSKRRTERGNSTSSSETQSVPSQSLPNRPKKQPERTGIPPSDLSSALISFGLGKKPGNLEKV